MVIVYWKICVWAKSKQPADFCYYTLKILKITDIMCWFDAKSPISDDNGYDDNAQT